MIYRKELNDFATALCLTKSQVIRINKEIAKAYDQKWHKDGPNIDQINAVVAPHLNTPEEAFYAATTILTDVMSALNMKP
jgi:hypothetical protein